MNALLILLAAIGLNLSVNAVADKALTPSFSYGNDEIFSEESVGNEISINSQSEGEYTENCGFSFMAHGVKDVRIYSSKASSTYSINEDDIRVSYYDIEQDAQSEIAFVFSEDNIQSISVFFNILDEKTYYSFASKESLLRYLNIGVNPNLDHDEAEATLLTNGAISKMPRSSSSAGYFYIGIINGYLKWSNSKGDSFPLRESKIKVTTPVGNYETYTDDEGYYLMYLANSTKASNPFTDISLHIYSESESTKVVDNNSVIYEECISGIDLTNMDEAYELDYTFNASTDIGKAMQISQAAKYYSDYVKELNGGEAISSCTIKYPDADTTSCFYRASEEMIHITKRKNDATGLESYESWDVIGHEYGHHVQRYFGISNSPGGKHYFSENCADILASDSTPTASDKLNGLRLAWGEAWPTYWATTAQQTFPADIKAINTVADDRYDSYNGANGSLNSYDDDGIKGDGCELAIARFLYKLYSPETDSLDKFSLGDETLWKIVTDTKPYYFYELVNALYSDGYSKSDLGLLLEAYGMSASNLGVAFLKNINPIFRWDAQGGSIYFPNDIFALHFFDENDTKILEIRDIKDTRYQLTDDEWTVLSRDTGKKFYVMLEAMANEYSTTGPYYSSKHEFEKPQEFYEVPIIPIDMRDWVVLPRSQ